MVAAIWWAAADDGDIDGEVVQGGEDGAAVIDGHPGINVGPDGEKIPHQIHHAIGVGGADAEPPDHRPARALQQPQRLLRVAEDITGDPVERVAGIG